MTLIGIVPSGVEARKLMINQDYVEGVLRAGGTPVLFPVTADPERLSGLLDRVDGLLLTGGEDVDPALYGEEKLPCCEECSPDRDAMELPLCREALNRRMPVFAICRACRCLPARSAEACIRISQSSSEKACSIPGMTLRPIRCIPSIFFPVPCWPPLWAFPRSG